jgi:hypothetical protein
MFLMMKCTDIVNNLSNYKMICFSKHFKQITPLEVSLEVSKSYISVDTAKKVINNSYRITCLKEFLFVMC